MKTAYQQNLDYRQNQTRYNPKYPINNHYNPWQQCQKLVVNLYIKIDFVLKLVWL